MHQQDNRLKNANRNKWRKLVKRLLATAAILAASLTTAHAGSPELPDKYLGHWCYEYATDTFRLMADRCDNPAWLNIQPTGLALSDGLDGPKMWCTLKSTSLKLDIFKCTHPAYETRGTTIEYMRLRIDRTGALHLGWKTGASK
jgi:hypothetical protein